MLYYDRIYISQGTDLTKSNNSKECMICHYWFFNHGFKVQDSVGNGCQVLVMLSVDCVDYCCIIHKISKSEAINLLENSILENCGCIYKILFRFSVYSRKFVFFTFFRLVYIKWSILSTSISLYLNLSLYFNLYLNISIGTVMKNPETLKFVPDHLKTKKMCKD